MRDPVADLARRLASLERRGLRYRTGEITDTTPLSVDLGASGAPVTSVRAVGAGAALDVGDVVGVLTFDSDLIILGRVTADGDGGASGGGGEVTQAEMDDETAARVAADSALDGRLDIVEADLPGRATDAELDAARALPRKIHSGRGTYPASTSARHVLVASGATQAEAGSNSYQGAYRFDPARFTLPAGKKHQLTLDVRGYFPGGTPAGQSFTVDVRQVTAAGTPGMTTAALSTPLSVTTATIAATPTIAAAVTATVDAPTSATDLVITVTPSGATAASSLNAITADLYLTYADA